MSGKVQTLVRLKTLTEGKVPKDVFRTSLQFIDENTFVKIIERRYQNKVCGYPLCDKIPKGHRKTSLICWRVGSKKKKFYCSSWCYKASRHLKIQIQLMVFCTGGDLRKGRLVVASSEEEEEAENAVATKDTRVEELSGIFNKLRFKDSEDQAKATPLIIKPKQGLETKAFHDHSTKRGGKFIKSTVAKLTGNPSTSRYEIFENELPDSSTSGEDNSGTVENLHSNYLIDKKVSSTTNNMSSRRIIKPKRRLNQLQEPRPTSSGTKPGEKRGKVGEQDYDEEGGGKQDYDEQEFEEQDNDERMNKMRK